MSKAITIYLALLFFGLSTSNGWVMVWFGANQTNIIAEFCENKDQPQLECNGKCHLAKTLKKAAQPSDSFPMEKLVKEEVKWWVSTGFFLAYVLSFERVNQVQCFYDNLYRFSRYHQLFRPPALD